VQVPESFRALQLVDTRFVRAVRASGLAVHVWTVDDPQAMHRLLDLGVGGIMTDQPEVLRDVLRSRGDWHPA
jgi:glycerophosphoryl diester phosphodiesterase